MSKSPLPYGALPYRDEIIGGLKAFARANSLICNEASRTHFAWHLYEPWIPQHKNRQVQVTGYQQKDKAGLTISPSFDVILPNAGNSGEIDRPTRTPAKYIIYKPVAELAEAGRFDPETLASVLQEAWDNSERMTRDWQLKTKTRHITPRLWRYLTAHGITRSAPLTKGHSLAGKQT
jgi:hypothetical protein